jgi:hypothetical protein
MLPAAEFIFAATSIHKVHWAGPLISGIPFGASLGKLSSFPRFPTTNLLMLLSPSRNLRLGQHLPRRRLLPLLRLCHGRQDALPVRSLVSSLPLAHVLTFSPTL